MNVRLELELLLRRYGWKLMAALFMTLAAGIFMLVQLAPPATVPPLVEATDGSRQMEMHHRAFRTVLVPRSEIETRQGEVLDAVVRHGLSVGHIDYGYESRAAGQYDLSSMQLPLRGSYADVRAFLSAVLAAHPGLAVEDLAIQRITDSPGIEARVKLALFTEEVRR